MTDSSGAGVWASVALLLLIAAFVSIISGPNECCNAVFCLRYGPKNFNAGLYLLLGWITFIIGVVLLYFGSIRELNSECPSEYEEPFELVKNGVMVAGGFLGLFSVIFASFYYYQSMQLAGLFAESGMLATKKKTLAASANDLDNRNYQRQADEEEGLGGNAMVPMEETSIQVEA